MNGKILIIQRKESIYSLVDDASHQLKDTMSSYGMIVDIRNLAGDLSPIFHDIKKSFGYYEKNKR